MRLRIFDTTRLIILVCLLVGMGEKSLAQSPYDLGKNREWIFLGAGGTLSVAALILMENVDPLTIEEINRLDTGDINSFDRKAIEPFREARVGDGLLYASYVLPLTFLVHPDTKSDWRILGVMWGEVMLINLGLNGIVKSLALRTRPYVYDHETPLEKKTKAEARMSFYSGHTSAAAANCFFVATVFNDYMTNNKAKALVWAGAAIYPALIGYLRRDSGHHFRTDVYTGYCIGALVGYFVPRLHRNGTGRELSLYATSILGAAGVGFHFSF